MSIDLTFKDVCAFIKNDDNRLAEAADKLLALPLLCSPLFMDGLGLLPLIAAKNELIKLCKWTLDVFTGKNDTDYIALHQRMKIAYGLICFTAFFDAIDRLLPEKVREQIALVKQERTSITKEALKRTGHEPDSDTDRFSLMPIVFPHPAESFDDQQQRLLGLYTQMAQGFGDFISHLVIWERAGDKIKSSVSQAIEKLPATAIAIFETQYFELTRRFEDFAVWANLHEHKKTKQLIDSLSAYVKNYAALAQDTKSNIDVGLTKLHEIVTVIPETLRLGQAEEIVAGLRKHYLARIAEPILEHKDDDDDKPRVSFPRVQDAFVPQSFRVLRQGSKGASLEDEDTWRGQPRRDNLGTFLLSYLSSPYSVETPLVILGHPGSGKSLLTTILSAQLLSSHYTAMRVPLREVNSDAGIVGQIEEHIRRVTNVRIDSWARVSAAFKNNPPIVILDGYDELLQASGKVFAGYLKDVQTFQKNEAEQGRPVRVIVTSRITLIDKAIIPPGSTIIRLLEFDKKQRVQWMGIWNKTNAHYFEKANLKSFSLPSDTDPDAEKILLLAEQPLLLLMLALYDSDGNSLRNSKIRHRTALYESLLRRFIERERGKSKDFEELSTRDKAKEIDADMLRLGVAAIGMYNRRKLHILSPELNEDLKFFALERTIHVQSGRALTQADLLLGSFFFVHKSTALQSKPAAGQHEESSAFEFLHNTFGEFLTADFIIRQALTEVQQLKALRSDDALQLERHRKLTNADGLSRAWFACFVYTPLFTRPVVLEMVREWIGHVLQRRKLSKTAFLTELNEIIQNQINRVLTKRDMPSIMQKEEVQEGFRAPFGFHPLIGHLAIYSINLILVRIILGGESFIFDENLVASHEDGARPWDQLAYLWRSWFSVDILNGVTAVMTAERHASTIALGAKDKLSVSESRSRLETLYNISVALGDNIVAGMSGLLLHDYKGDNTSELDELNDKLASENIDVELEIATRKLNELMSHDFPADSDEIESAAVAAFERAWHLERFQELGEIIFLIERFVKRLSRQYSGSAEHHVTRHLGRLLTERIPDRSFFGLASANPDAAIALIGLTSAISNRDWSEHYGYRFFDHLAHPGFIEELVAHRPEVAVVVLEALSRWGSGRARERFRHFKEPILGRTNLRRLAERSPEKIATFVAIALQLGEEPQVVDELIEGELKLMTNSDWSMTRPEVIMELLRISGTFGGWPWTENFGSDRVRRWLSEADLHEWIMRNPDKAVEFFELARGAGMEDVADRIAQRSVERMLKHAPPIDWMEESPTLLLNLLEIPLQLRSSWAEHFVMRLLDHPRYEQWMRAATRHDPTLLIRMFRIAEVSGVKSALLLQGLHDILDHPKAIKKLLATLKLDALPDLKWLARSTGNRTLNRMLEELNSVALI